MIETNRLLLRPYVVEDWSHVHAYAAIPEFTRFEVWGPNSVEDTKRFVGACIASMSVHPILGYQLAVVLRDADRLIGEFLSGESTLKSRRRFSGTLLTQTFSAKATRRKRPRPSLSSDSTASDLCGSMRSAMRRTLHLAASWKSLGCVWFPCARTTKRSKG